MKKFLVTALAAAASAAAFAGMDNVVITFSTPGPDKYADGTTVLDNERYALVWTPNGSTFEGINANGTAAGDSEVVVSVPVAANGRCPLISFEIEEDVVAAKGYKNGSWSVCLLDTRVFALDATTGQPVIEGGVRKVASYGSRGVANGYGVIGDAKVVEGGASGASVGGVAATSETVAADTPAPVISDIRFDGDNVLVKVSSTSPAFKYALVAGDAPDAVNTEVTNPEGKDFGSATKEITLVTQKKVGGEFFKINCK